MSQRNLTDWTFTRLLSLTPFYRGGWGDKSVVADVRKRFFAPGAPAEIDPCWIDEHRESGATVREGYFRTPVNLPMPPEVRTAWFQMLLPPHARDQKPPVVIHLAATSDQGYRHRRRLAKRLLYRGIGSVILENPYYGKRRPSGQLGVALDRVSDQLLMNFATIEEARALLRWLSSRGHSAVGVTGYSMGGFMSAYAAALYPDPIVAVPCAAGISPGFTFVHTPMRTVPDWSAIERDVDDPMGEFERLLGELGIDRLPVPADPSSAIILAAERDAVVPPEQSIALHAHWEGSRLRWLKAGHITGFLAHLGPISDAVYDAFAVRIYRSESD